ncbi:uncharacterized protein LOC126264962 [Aethina tumida]|uniref:uncharacterized protein LOC126264962 n=1 Tax=Aethina tumida TaxID=116153 RepID=UPI0021481AF6|nr:uncharacterized protein LOC126264962 [Aethina tumida]
MATVTTTEAPVVDQRIGCWVETNLKCLPLGFFVAGKDHDRSVGIIRGHYKNKFYIGKYVEGYGVYIPDGDTEVNIKLDKDHIFEILCDSKLSWDRCGGKVPANAFVAGHTEDGKQLNIGKTNMKGNTVVGWIQYNLLYYTWEGTTYNIANFEVLVPNFCVEHRQIN